MEPVLIMAIGFLAIIFTFVLMSFYKVFIKKKNLSPYYTPFDEITGQSQVEYHVEQEILAVDAAQGDNKDKKKK